MNDFASLLEKLQILLEQLYQTAQKVDKQLESVFTEEDTSSRVSQVKQLADDLERYYTVVKAIQSSHTEATFEELQQRVEQLVTALKSLNVRKLETLATALTKVETVLSSLQQLTQSQVAALNTMASSVVKAAEAFVLLQQSLQALQAHTGSTLSSLFDASSLTSMIESVKQLRTELQRLRRTNTRIEFFEESAKYAKLLQDVIRSLERPIYFEVDTKALAESVYDAIHKAIQKAFSSTPVVFSIQPPSTTSPSTPVIITSPTEQQATRTSRRKQKTTSSASTSTPDVSASEVSAPDVPASNVSASSPGILVQQEASEEPKKSKSTRSNLVKAGKSATEPVDTNITETYSRDINRLTEDPYYRATKASDTFYRFRQRLNWFFRRAFHQSLGEFSQQAQSELADFYREIKPLAQNQALVEFRDRIARLLSSDEYIDSAVGFVRNQTSLPFALLRYAYSVQPIAEEKQEFLKTTRVPKSKLLIDELKTQELFIKDVVAILQQFESQIPEPEFKKLVSTYKPDRTSEEEFAAVLRTLIDEYRDFFIQYEKISSNIIQKLNEAFSTISRQYQQGTDIERAKYRLLFGKWFMEKVDPTATSPSQYEKLFVQLESFFYSLYQRLVRLQADKNLSPDEAVADIRKILSNMVAAYAPEGVDPDLQRYVLRAVESYFSAYATRYMVEREQFVRLYEQEHGTSVIPPGVEREWLLSFNNMMARSMMYHFYGLDLKKLQSIEKRVEGEKVHFVFIMDERDTGPIESEDDIPLAVDERIQAATQEIQATTRETVEQPKPAVKSKRTRKKKESDVQPLVTVRSVLDEEYNVRQRVYTALQDSMAAVDEAERVQPGPKGLFSLLREGLSSLMKLPVRLYEFGQTLPQAFSKFLTAVQDGTQTIRVAMYRATDSLRAEIDTAAKDSSSAITSMMQSITSSLKNALDYITRKFKELIGKLGPFGDQLGEIIANLGISLKELEKQVGSVQKAFAEVARLVASNVLPPLHYMREKSAPDKPKEELEKLKQQVVKTEDVTGRVVYDLRGKQVSEANRIELARSVFEQVFQKAPLALVLSKQYGDMSPRHVIMAVPDVESQAGFKSYHFYTPGYDQPPHPIEKATNPIESEQVFSSYMEIIPVAIDQRYVNEFVEAFKAYYESDAVRYGFSVGQETCVTFMYKVLRQAGILPKKSKLLETEVKTLLPESLGLLTQAASTYRLLQSSNFDERLQSMGLTSVKEYIDQIAFDATYKQELNRLFNEALETLYDASRRLLEESSKSFAEVDFLQLGQAYEKALSTVRSYVRELKQIAESKHDRQRVAVALAALSDLAITYPQEMDRLIDLLWKYQDSQIDAVSFFNEIVKLNPKPQLRRFLRRYIQGDPVDVLRKAAVDMYESYGVSDTTTRAHRITTSPFLSDKERDVVYRLYMALGRFFTHSEELRNILYESSNKMMEIESMPQLIDSLKALQGQLRKLPDDIAQGLSKDIGKLVRTLSKEGVTEKAINQISSLFQKTGEHTAYAILTPQDVDEINFYDKTRARLFASAGSVGDTRATGVLRYLSGTRFIIANTESAVKSIGRVFDALRNLNSGTAIDAADSTLTAIASIQNIFAGISELLGFRTQNENTDPNRSLFEGRAKMSRYELLRRFVRTIGSVFGLKMVPEEGAPKTREEAAEKAVAKFSKRFKGLPESPVREAAEVYVKELLASGGELTGDDPKFSMFYSTIDERIRENLDVYAREIMYTYLRDLERYNLPMTPEERKRLDWFYELRERAVDWMLSGLPNKPETPEESSLVRKAQEATREIEQMVRPRTDVAQVDLSTVAAASPETMVQELNKALGSYRQYLPEKLIYGPDKERDALLSLYKTFMKGIKRRSTSVYESFQGLDLEAAFSSRDYTLRLISLLPDIARDLEKAEEGTAAYEETVQDVFLVYARLLTFQEKLGKEQLPHLRKIVQRLQRSSDESHKELGSLLQELQQTWKDYPKDFNPVNVGKLTPEEFEDEFVRILKTHLGRLRRLTVESGQRRPNVAYRSLLFTTDEIEEMSRRMQDLLTLLSERSQHREELGMVDKGRLITAPEEIVERVKRKKKAKTPPEESLPYSDVSAVLSFIYRISPDLLKEEETTEKGLQQISEAVAKGMHVVNEVVAQALKLTKESINRITRTYQYDAEEAAKEISRLLQEHAPGSELLQPLSTTQVLALRSLYEQGLLKTANLPAFVRDILFKSAEAPPRSGEEFLKPVVTLRPSLITRAKAGEVIQGLTEEQNKALQRFASALTDEEIAFIKAIEVQLKKAFEGTELESASDAVLFAGKDTLIRAVKATFGQDSDMYKKLMEFLDIGASGFSVNIEGVPISFIFNDLQDKVHSTQEVLVHELTHAFLLSASETNQDIVNTLESLKVPLQNRLQVLLQNEKTRQALLEHIGTFSEKYKSLIDGILEKIPDYLAIPDEAIAHITQALASGNVEFLQALEAVYGKTLFNRLIAEVKTIMPKLTEKIKEGNLNLEGIELDAKVESIWLKIVSFAKATMEELERLTGQRFSKEELLNRIRSLLRRTSVQEEFVGAFFEDSSSIEKFLYQTLYKREEPQETGVINRIRSFIERQSIKTRLGQELTALALGGEISNLLGYSVPSSDVFDAFNKAFKAKTGEELSRFGFSVERTYDFEQGVTRLIASARTASGETTRLAATINKLGEIEVESKSKLDQLAQRLREEFMQEVFEELSEEIIYGVIYTIQEVFSQVAAIQDEVRKLTSIISQTGLSWADAKAKTSELVTTMIDIAAQTGQGFEESIRTFIQNYASLAGIESSNMREQLATSMAELQLGAQSVFGLTLEQSLEFIPAIYTQIRDELTRNGSSLEDAAVKAQEQINGLFDLFVRAGQYTGASYRDIVQVYSELLPISRNLGMSREDLIAFSATASVRLGMSPEETVNSIKYFFERLYDPERVEELARLGIATRSINQETGIIQNRPVLDVLADLYTVASQSPEMERRLSNIIGRFARASEVSRLINMFQEMENTRLDMYSRLSGDEYEREIEMKAMAFEGLLNTVRSNIGLVFQSLLFSTGVADSFAQSLANLTKVVATFATFLGESGDVAEKVGPFISALGQVILYNMLNIGKEILSLVGRLSNLSIPRTVYTMFDPGAPLVERAARVFGVASNYGTSLLPETTIGRIIQNLGGLTDEQMSRVRTVVDYTVNAGKELRDAFIKLSREVLRGSKTVEQAFDELEQKASSLYQQSPESLRRAVATLTEAADRIQHRVRGQAVDVPDQDGAQASVQTSATRASTPQTATQTVQASLGAEIDEESKRKEAQAVADAVTAQTALKSATMQVTSAQQRQTAELKEASVKTAEASSSLTKFKSTILNTTVNLSRMASNIQSFLMGFSRGSYTGVSPLWATSTGGFIKAAAGPAVDIGLMALSEFLLSGLDTSAQTWTNIGVGIAGGILGTLVTGGNPMGTAIGFQMAQAFSEAFDAYGLFFGLSDREKAKFESSYSQLPEKERTKLLDFYKSGLFDKIIKEYGKALIVNPEDYQKDLGFWGNWGRSIELGSRYFGDVYGTTSGALTQLRNPVTALAEESQLFDTLGALQELQGFDPELIPLIASLGVSSYQDLVPLLEELDKREKEYQQRLQELKERFSRERGSRSANDPMLTTIQDMINLITGEVSTRAGISSGTTARLSPQEYALYAPFGLLQQRAMPALSDFESIEQWYDTYQSILNRLSSTFQALPTLKKLEDYFDVEGLKESFIELDSTSQSTFMGMASSITEAIAYVEEYEKTLEAIKQLEEVAAKTSIATVPEEYQQLEATLQKYYEKIQAMQDMYVVYRNYLAMLKTEPNSLLEVIKKLKEAARQKRVQEQIGTPSQFRMPALVDVAGYTIEDIQNALRHARDKQRRIIQMFPQMRSEFAKEQFLLEAGSQLVPVTGVSQAYFQEFLRSQKSIRGTLPQIVDVRDIPPEKLPKIIQDTIALQQQAVALAPELASQYADERLLLLQQNNQVLSQVGLSQEFLRYAIEANTKATDDNTNELRGHYNLPASYRPPTIWDYYAAGGKEAGAVNYVPPPGVSNNMVSLDFATQLAQQIAQATATGVSAAIPDLSVLGSLVDPSARPLGYPEPGTGGRRVVSETDETLGTLLRELEQQAARLTAQNALLEDDNLYKQRMARTENMLDAFEQRAMRTKPDAGFSVFVPVVASGSPGSSPAKPSTEDTLNSAFKGSEESIKDAFSSVALGAYRHAEQTLLSSSAVKSAVASLQNSQQGISRFVDSMFSHSLTTQAATTALQMFTRQLLQFNIQQLIDTMFGKGTVTVVINGAQVSRPSVQVTTSTTSNRGTALKASGGPRSVK